MGGVAVRESECLQQVSSVVLNLTFIEKRVSHDYWASGPEYRPDQ